MSALEVLKTMRAQLDETIAMLERTALADADVPKKRGVGRPKKEKVEKSDTDSSAEKKKRVLTPEHLAKMKAGREAAKAKRDAEKAAAAAEKDGEEAASLSHAPDLNTSVDASSVSDGGSAAGGKIAPKKTFLKRKAASVAGSDA